MQCIAANPKSYHLKVKNRGGGCIFSHLSFSSRVPREVTDKAWMNSENSMRPSYRLAKGRERERESERKWPRDKMSIVLHTCCSCTFMNSLLFFQDVLASFCRKRGQTVAPSQLLFLPCTWLSPEAEICHLWSLGRWMLLVHSLKVTAHKHTTTVYSIKKIPMIQHQEWAWQIFLSDKVENIYFLTFISSQLC